MTDKKIISVVKGDGIGPEIIAESMKLMKLVEQYSNLKFEFIDTPCGGGAYKEFGSSLPDKSFEQMKKSDAILYGAVGLPDLPQGVAEYGLLKMRQGLDQYVNLRPAKLYEPIRDACPLKEEYIQKGIDMVIVRENTESIYTKIGGEVHGDAAVSTMVYTKRGVERIIKYAFEYAKRKNMTEMISVDKANVVQCSAFWRNIYTEIGKQYPKIKQTNFYVDAFCQWLIRKPYTVQCVVTENMFGDIVSDEAAYLIGSLGMAPCGNINPEGVSMYEPIHGSAPDIAGQGIANPIGSILSVKMMLEESFHEAKLGQLIEDAVIATLYKGRTKDIMTSNATKEGKVKTFTTKEMGTAICEELTALLKK